MRSPTYGVVLRWSAVVVLIVALSPVPLAIPSGIALAMIGLAGAALLMLHMQRTAIPTPRPAPLRGIPGDFTGGKPHRRSGARG